MKILLRTLAACFPLLCAFRVPSADPVAINAARNYSPEEIAAAKGNRAGLSGRVAAVVGDGVVGGFAVGVPITEKSRVKLATGSAVKDGWLPPIKPVWNVHMRDTDIILCGDGNYYLTGSSGDNIWSYNDGIELWRSPDLQTWSYLGLVYFGSTDKYHGRYSMCMAISDNIYGPYRLRHETVPCNGGTNFFHAKDGFWYSSFFGDDSNAPWREKPGIVRIDFDAEGRISVAKTQPDFILLK